MDWFQIRKGVHQGCILSPCLFNLYAARLDETQAGIKNARRNINNLRYADDTILMAESEEERMSLLMKVKEQSEKPGLKLNIQKTKIMESGPITSWQIDGERMETVRDFIFLGSQITADGDCSHEIKTLVPWKKRYDKPRQHIIKQRHYFADNVKVLHSLCQQIWKTQQWPQDWKRSVFIPIPKKGNANNVQTSTESCSFHTLTK